MMFWSGIGKANWMEIMSSFGCLVSSIPGIFSLSGVILRGILFFFTDFFFFFFVGLFMEFCCIQRNTGWSGSWFFVWLYFVFPTSLLYCFPREFHLSTFTTVWFSLYSFILFFYLFSFFFFLFCVLSLGVSLLGGSRPIVGHI